MANIGTNSNCKKINLAIYTFDFFKFNTILTEMNNEIREIEEEQKKKPDKTQ